MPPHTWAHLENIAKEKERKECYRSRKHCGLRNETFANMEYHLRSLNHVTNAKNKHLFAGIDKLIELLSVNAFLRQLKQKYEQLSKVHCYCLLYRLHVWWNTWNIYNHMLWTKMHKTLLNGGCKVGKRKSSRTFWSDRTEKLHYELHRWSLLWVNITRCWVHC